jgi:hypothetical protein
MIIYFLYREVSSSRRELIGRADSEARARAMAIEHSRRQPHAITVDACRPATLESRLVHRFRDGAPLREAIS